MAPPAPRLPASRARPPVTCGLAQVAPSVRPQTGQSGPAATGAPTLTPPAKCGQHAAGNEQQFHARLLHAQPLVQHTELVACT
eukprot:361140-Chlamydomonas_euryale.AAC.6